MGESVWGPKLEHTQLIPGTLLGVSGVSFLTGGGERLRRQRGKVIIPKAVLFCDDRPGTKAGVLSPCL